MYVNGKEKPPPSLPLKGEELTCHEQNKRSKYGLNVKFLWNCLQILEIFSNFAVESVKRYPFITYLI